MRGEVSVYVGLLAYPSGLERERWEPAEEQDGQQGEREREQRSKSSKEKRQKQPRGE